MLFVRKMDYTVLNNKKVILVVHHQKKKKTILQGTRLSDNAISQDAAEKNWLVDNKLQTTTLSLMIIMC